MTAYSILKQQNILKICLPVLPLTCGMHYAIFYTTEITETLQTLPRNGLTMVGV